MYTQRLTWFELRGKLREAVNQRHVSDSGLQSADVDLSMLSNGDFPCSSPAHHSQDDDDDESRPNLDTSSSPILSNVSPPAIESSRAIDDSCVVDGLDNNVEPSPADEFPVMETFHDVFGGPIVDDISRSNIEPLSLIVGNGQNNDESFGELVKRKRNELHGIFAVNASTLICQRMILTFFRDLSPMLLENMRRFLPVDGRTLRPPQIQHVRRIVIPGVLAYWGIQEMFNMAGGLLFDVDSNEINLSVNMDGLPLFQSSNGKGFWPILASVEDYPVFAIGAYEGVGKPHCGNDYLRDFVDEAKKLVTNGVIVNCRVYKFRVLNFILDSPATALVTGVKHHGGYCACRRCKIVGEMVWHVYHDKEGKEHERRLGVRYPTLHNEMRTHEEFVKYSIITPDPHPQTSEYVTNNKEKAINSESEQINYADEGTNSKDDPEEGVRDEAKNDLNAAETDECAPARSTSSKKTKQTRYDKFQYHLHPTILTEIPGLDIVKDFVLDFMHFMSGHMKTLLEYHSGSGVYGAMYKLDKKNLDLIEERLEEARKYYPHEFGHRKSDPLKVLASWKATQFRHFVLYLGVSIFRNTLEEAKLHHFHLLCVAFRLMCRRLPEPPDRAETVKQAANISRKLLSEYLAQGNKLYGKNFALYLVHHFPHIPDDYERFQKPLDKLSAFRYENANKAIKHMITGHFQPLTQMINKLSSLLYTKLYARVEKKRIIHSTDEYYEEPELRLRLKQTAGNEVAAHDIERFEQFQELRYRSFKLDTAEAADSYFLMMGEEKDYYVRVRKILKDKDTGEINLIGQSFERIRPLFTLNPTLPKLSSMLVGINVCDQLSDGQHTFSLSALREKCFALPLHLGKHIPEGEVREWVLIRYLH